MPTPHPELALSAVETELLRDLRSRLNRLPPGDKAQDVLGGAFLKACLRVGVGPLDGEHDHAGVPAMDVKQGAAALIAIADAADMRALTLLTTGLSLARKDDPALWRALLKGGVGQAVLSRRLALGGREPAKHQGPVGA